MRFWTRGWNSGPKKSKSQVTVEAGGRHVAYVLKDSYLTCLILATDVTISIYEMNVPWITASATRIYDRLQLTLILRTYILSPSPENLLFAVFAAYKGPMS